MPSYSLVWNDHSAQRNPAELSFDSEDDAFAYARNLPQHKTTLVTLTLDGRPVFEGAELEGLVRRTLRPTSHVQGIAHEPLKERVRVNFLQDSPFKVGSTISVDVSGNNRHGRIRDVAADGKSADVVLDGQWYQFVYGGPFQRGDYWLIA